MTHLKQSSIRRLLFFFLLLSPLPLAGLSWIHLRTFEHALQETVLTNLVSLADKKTDQINNYLEERQAAGQMIAAMPIIGITLDDAIAGRQIGRSLNLLQQRIALPEMLDGMLAQAGFLDLLLVLPDGKVAFATRRDPWANADLAGPAWRDTSLGRAWQATMQSATGQFTQAGIYPDDPGQGSIFLVLPVGDGGRPRGTLVLKLDFARLTAVSGDRTGLGDSGETVLAQREGDTALYVGPLRHAPAAAFVRRVAMTATPPPMRAGLDGDHGSGITRDYAGIEVVAAWRHLPIPGWGMVVKIDQAEAFAPLHKVRTTSLVTLLAFILSASAAALLLAQQQGETARREAEQSRALAESEAILKRAQEVANLGVWQFDLPTDKVFWSEETHRIFAIAPGMPIGHEAFASRLHPDDAAAVDAAWQAALSSGTAYDHIHRLQIDGQVKWVHEQAELRFDAAGRLVGGIGTIQDITAQVEAEEARRRSEELLRSAVETVDAAFVVHDADDRLVFCNETYRNTYPMAADLIRPGQRFEDILRHCIARGLHPDARGNEDAWIADRLARHHETKSDFIQQLDDGRWLRIKEKRTASGHIVGFRLDVTELVQAREAAEAANRFKSEFLANMSHEIRTPMNAMLGLTQQALAGEMAPDQRALLEKGLEAGRSLLAILNEILDYSRIEADRIVIENVPFSLDAMLSGVWALYAPGCRQKGLSFDVDLASCLPEQVSGDPLRLGQVLGNLIGNAIKFTAHGGIRVGIKAGRSGEDGWRIDFTITDSGIGIAPEALGQLFKPFTQADGSITRQYGGTGLGLAICRRLVTLMGGEIDVTSVLGEGSTFHFHIILGTVHGAAQAVTPPPTTAHMACSAQVMPAGTAPPDAHALRQLLERLRPALEAHEPLADDLQQELVMAARQADPQSHLARLWQQIDHFDHRGARITLELILAQGENQSQEVKLAR